MYLPGLVDPCCHPSFCAAYTTGVELALADLAAKAAPASSVPSRTTPASSLLTISDVLATGVLCPSQPVPARPGRGHWPEARSSISIRGRTPAAKGISGVPRHARP